MQIAVDDPVRVRPGKTQVEIILPYAGDDTLRMERTRIVDRKASDCDIRAMGDGKSRNITVEHQVRPLAAQGEIPDPVQIEKQPFQPGAVVGDIRVFFKSQIGINVVGAGRHDQFPHPVLPAILHGTPECEGRIVPTRFSSMKSASDTDSAGAPQPPAQAAQNIAAQTILEPES